MIRILLITLLYITTSFSCGLCTVYSPQTLASIDVVTDDSKIKNIDVTLKLTEEFTTSLKDLYDMNADMKLDKIELEKIQGIFEDYAKPKRYFVTLSYDKVIRKETFNKIKVTDFRTYIENDILHFNYKVNLDYKLYENYFLSIKIDDDEKFFLISLYKEGLTFNGNSQVDKVTNNNSVIFSINGSKTEIKQQEVVQEEIKKEVEKQTSFLVLFTNKIKAYLVSIRNGDMVALISLLLISFVYGIVHAIGPGHGKALTFAYFSSNKSSYTKAFIISQASAFVHIIGALILVMVSVFILESVLNNFVNDSVRILTQISAVMIVLLSIYILNQKLRKQDCACASCQPSEPKPTWTSQKPEQPALQKQGILKQKQDLYFVLTAGLIPCPGTVVLFIYAFILKTYFAVLLAAMAISLGMGLVLFMTSFLGVGMNRISQRSHLFNKVVNYISPIVMMILGLMLFVNANAL